MDHIHRAAELEPTVISLIVALLGHRLVIAASVMLALTFGWTAMRITSRRIGGINFLPADYLYFTGQLFYIAFFVACVLQDVYGHKDPNELATNSNLVANLVNSALASRIAYVLVLLCVKLSIGVLLQNLLGFTSRRMNIACWAAIVISIAWAIYALVVFLAICSPANGTDKTGAGCADVQSNYTVVYAIDVFTDLVLLVLPIQPLGSLRVRLAHKVALLAMFSGGIVTMACSAAFLAALWTNAQISSIVGVVQAGIALLVASSTVLRPLFDVTVVRWLGLESLRPSNEGHNISLVTWGASGEPHRGESGALTKISARRSQRPRQISESEENLTIIGGGNFQKVDGNKEASHTSDSDIPR